ncbi:MAG: tetratricopeptide repeat protein [Marinilabiliaceae bacterium]
MERKNHLRNFSTLVIFLVLILSSSFGQTSGRDSIFYHSYTTTEMETWKQTMHQMEKEYEEGDPYEELFELTLAWYGYMGYCIGNDREDEAEEYLEDGWKYLELLLDSPQTGAAAHALKSGFYGFEMALAKYKAVTLGRKSVKALEKAAEIDSSNVHYHVEKGNQMYYMPSFLGGDDEVALYHYKKAVETIEEGKAYHKHHWFYLNTMVVLAHTYERTGNIDKARQTYRNLLNHAPRFKWLRDELWPDFVEKHGV